MELHALSAAELLSCWEQGLEQQPVQRALTLLAASSPETAPDTLARLSIGQRDAGLLRLRAWIFGPQLCCLAGCPACEAQVELEFDVGDIWVADQAAPPEALSASIAGYAVRFRLPNSLDLAAVAGQAEVAQIRHLLLERCVLAAECHGKEAAAGDLPAEVGQAIVEHMAQADPQADVQLTLTCPECGHGWLAAFDIVSFFWGEINAWAARILHEVHILATAYGWTEPEILALSPRRRQLYMEMIGG